MTVKNGIKIERPEHQDDLAMLAYKDCGIYLPYNIIRPLRLQSKIDWWEAATTFLRLRYGDDFILEFGPGKNPDKPAGIGLNACSDPGADIWWDLNHGIPLASESLAGVYGNQFLEHLYKRSQIYFMNEVWRVLKPGGTAEFLVPHYLSPDADGDPTHYTRFSQNSFRYFCINPATGKPFVDEFSDYGIEPAFILRKNFYRPYVDVHAVLEKPHGS